MELNMTLRQTFHRPLNLVLDIWCTVDHLGERWMESHSMNVANIKAGNVSSDSFGDVKRTKKFEFCDGGFGVLMQTL